MGKISLGIKVHFYNDYVEQIYKEWQKVLGDSIFLLMDETNGPVDTKGARKVSWSLQQCEKMGLPLIPAGKAAWYNGDYPYYCAAEQMADDEFCIVTEYDVFVKIKNRQYWAAFFKKCAEYDFVAARIGNRKPHWRWRRDLSSLYDHINGALIVIVGFNKTGANFLKQKRLAIQSRRQKLNSEEWPHCEAFVGTELHGTDKIKVGDISQFIKIERDNFRTIPPFLLDDVVARGENDLLYHPALGREAFLRKIRPYVRTKKPTEQVWDAVKPFVKNASADEIKTLDAMAQRFWGTKSFKDSFERLAAKIPTRRSAPA